MKKLSRFLALLLAFCMIFSLQVSAATSKEALDEAVENTASFMLQTVKSPQVGSIGGEWAVFGLARSGYAVPQSYWDNYYKTVVEYVQACDGNLSNVKHTEYSRLIVALTAIGADPTKVGEYNLLAALGDYDKTIAQGLNGPIWALIALDSANYPMPVNENAVHQATRQMYVDRILECQLPDGGWSLFGGSAAAAAGDGVSDPDITGMAFQALAKYQDQEAVKTATDEALVCMSELQNDRGGFSSWGTENSESCVQMICGLTELGISLDDPRFVADSGMTLVDNLMTFYTPNAGFQHTHDGQGSNQMAAEQGFYGAIAVQRAMDKKTSLYRMTDVTIQPETEFEIIIGLEGKDENVKKMPIVEIDKTYLDIAFDDDIAAIEGLAEREIIAGKPDGNFYPEDTMTRAEFATIVVKALGLTPCTTKVFDDVISTDWFAPYVGTANTYGIVNGTSAGIFNPQGTISRQEAAVMVARAAKLCGMDTDYDNQAVRDSLAGFMDYVTVADYAQSSVAFCYAEEILDPTVMDVHPTEAITRGEIAYMVFNLLGSANLL